MASSGNKTAGPDTGNPAGHGRRSLSPAYTMIQWMAMVCVLAILSASVPLIYRAYRANVYEAEVIKALCRVKIAQDEHFAHHGKYAGGEKLVSVPDASGLGLTNSSAIDTRYVSLDDLFLSVNYPQADEYLLICLPAEKGPGARLTVDGLAMDHEGTLYRGDRNRPDAWRPRFPHRKEVP